MKKQIIIYGIIWLVFLGMLGALIPLAKKDLQLRSMRKDIQRIEAQIEFNKEQWANCDANMKLWNDENNANREMLKNLKDEYNSMVGFTEAWLQ